MSLEPVILNEVQLKSDEIKTKLDVQTQNLVADSATKRDEVNAHTSTVASQVVSDINSETVTTLNGQTTTLQQNIADSRVTVEQHVSDEASRIIISNTSAVESSRDSVNSSIASARDNIKSHTAAEVKKSTDAIAAQTTSLNSSINSARDNIKSHTAAEVKKSTDAIAAQTTSLNSSINSARDNVKSHVTAESNRVVSELLSSTDKLYGHEVVVSVSTPASVSIAPYAEYSITPPTGCFIRIVLLYMNGGSPVLKSLGAGTLNLGITSKTSINNSQLGGTEVFRVGGSLLGSSDQYGANPLQYIDGAINEPIVIKCTVNATAKIVLAYQVIKIE